MEGAPWDYDVADSPPRVLATFFGWEMTDFFLVTFLVFGGFALLCWAVIHECSQGD